MKSAEITDRVIEELKTGKHRFARLNYPNGDMVGHTGVFEAAIQAVEAVDLGLGRLLDAVRQIEGIALVTADHGNSDEMFECDAKGNPKLDAKGLPKPKTSHSLNPVPFIVFDPGYRNEYRLRKLERSGLSNVAATCMEFLGFQPPDDYDPSLLEWM